MLPTLHLEEFVFVLWVKSQSQHCGITDGPSACQSSILCGGRFLPRQLHFRFSFLRMAWERQQKMPQVFGFQPFMCETEMKPLTSCWSRAVYVVDIRGKGQLIEHLPLSVIPCLSNSFKKKFFFFGNRNIVS